MKKKHISVSLILLILLMLLIFWFSAQPAEESELTSSGFCTMAAKIIYRRYASYTPEMQKIITEGLAHTVRKMAHFTEYACMGFLWYLFLRKKKMNILISIVATGVYAASDEWHQRFVSGRSGQISDVFLDTCGGCFGVLAGFVLLCILYCCTHKNVMSFGVWKK